MKDCLLFPLQVLILFLSTASAAVRFFVSPQRLEYVQEGQTVSLKWEYSVDSEYTLLGTSFVSFDPPGSNNDFRLAAKTADNKIFYFPNKPRITLGISLCDGRVIVKDQATLEITNVTLDNFYRLEVVFEDSKSGRISETSESVRVIPTGRYWH